MSEEHLAMEAEEVLDSSDSDSDDSNEENDSQEEALIQRAAQLENDLADSKYLYDTHVELVGIYKKLGDLKSLREAFQRFHEYFPLTPTLWMDWINVEKSVATSEDEKEFIFQLFDKAVEDYLSIELWSEYAQYAIGATSLERTRTILERGVNAAGLVCNGAALLWATYREIENLHVALYQEGSEEWKTQISKVADIFKRELSIPLLEMESTYEEWKNWTTTLPEGQVDSKPVEYGYNKAKKTLEIYQPFEEELLSVQSNEEVLNTYKKYIKAVIDPSTVICLFERAASPLCLVPEFWIEYCTYVFKLGDQALTVCKKALRNCPWSEELWVLKLRVLENLKKKEETVMECFEEGISSITPSPGLELWLTYLEFTHRNVDSPEKLDKLFNQAIQQLGFENDPQCKVSKLFCRILAHRGAMKEARKIWGHILSKSMNKGSSAFWLEYANLEKQYGEPHTLRSLFQRALNAIKDWPQCIMDEWLMYERHTGTLEDVMKCIQKCREVNTTFNQSYQHQEEKPQEQSSTSGVHQNSELLNKGRKRKIDNRDLDKAGNKFKRPREDKQERTGKRPNPADTHTEEERKTKPSVDKNPNTTVFVSNLLPGVSEQKLETIFPNALNLEIARDRKGKSRCFGYVQFKTQEEVMVALARDREPLDGRPVFISEIKRDLAEKKPVFKYATNEEKNKLFVRGLPIKKTKEEIEEIFKQYGAKDVRLVLHKSGQPKGLAYVEFETQDQARKALKETDQMTIDDHVITVAVSAPPPKKDKQSYKFGGTFDRKEDDEPIRHARSRLQTSLIPRSLQVKSSGDKKEEEKNDGEGDKKMRSNNDFRALLLKK